MKYKPVITVVVFSDGDWSLLKRTLWSLDQQIFRPFEIILLLPEQSEIDDLIQDFATESRRAVYILSGFSAEESQAVNFNRALAQMTTDYVFTTQAGCVLKEDVLQSHYERRAERTFLSGGIYPLNRSLYNRISRADIATQRAFKRSWLLDNGLKESFRNFKLTSHYVSLRLMDALSPKVACWRIENSSGWKRDLIEINGMDTRYHQANFDTDLGIRLSNNGVSTKQICYSSLVLIPEGYTTGQAISHEMSERNRMLIEELNRTNRSTTAFGINF